MGDLFLWVCVCFLGFVFCSVSTCKTAYKMRWVGNPNQPAGGKEPPKNDPTTGNAQLYPESQHKWHKGHPKSILFRRSRRLHHWIPQVSYHRSSHHKDRESKQINLRSRSKQEESPKMGRKRDNPQTKGKEESLERMLNETEASNYQTLNSK